MQPLARFAPRLIFESIAPPSASRTLRTSNRPSLRTSTCLQCRIHTQTRLFADPSKPPSDSSKPSELPKSSSQSENPPISELPSQNHTEDVPTNNLPSSQESRRLALTK